MSAPPSCVVGFLWYSAHSSVAGAQQELAAAQAPADTPFRSEAAKYADVPKTYAQVTAAEAELTTAMGNEIRFSFVLNDLSLTIPAKVWLTQVTITQDVDGTSHRRQGRGGTRVSPRLGVQGVAFTLPGRRGLAADAGQGQVLHRPLLQ